MKRFSKVMLFLVVALALAWTPMQANASTWDSVAGLGIQLGAPVTGIHANFQLQNRISIQGIFGVNDILHLAVKPRIGFYRPDPGYLDVYGWGIVGLSDIEDMYLGGGIGAEYDMRGLDASLPPIGIALDIGVVAGNNTDLSGGLVVTYYF